MGLATVLKKKLILSYFERKKTKTPFDLDASEGFKLPADADINVNNSHFFTASNESGETLSIRLGMRNNSDYEIFVLWRSRDGRFFVHEKDSYSPADCPVKFTMIEAEKRWRTEFKGSLREVSLDCAGVEPEIFDSEINVEFEAGLPIYDFVYHADRFNGMADAIAREKWNKDFFAEIGKNNQRHYEQTGHMTGSVRIGDETFAVNLPCVRDHSFGQREWDLMNDHIWFCCQRDNGEALSFSIVNYPRMKRIFSGYTNIAADSGASADSFGAGRPGKNPNRTLRDYEIVSYDPAAGLGGKVLQIVCWFPAPASAGSAKSRKLFFGKHHETWQKYELTLTRTDNVKCVFGGGKYIFQEGLAEFSISVDNSAPIHARGTLEYGFNTNPVRWESYEKIL